MAVVVKLADRAAPQPAREDQAVGGPLRSADIVILPCIRRERLALERRQEEPAASAHG